MKKLLYLSTVFILLAVNIKPLPVIAYNQGPTDAHVLMVRQALTILRNDGFGAIADQVDRIEDPAVGELIDDNLRAMILGIRDADDQYGRIYLEMLGDDTANWNAAGNTHYYNPAAHHAQSGLKIGVLHGTDSSIYFFYDWGIVIGSSLVPGDGDPNRVFALRGPQPSAANLADWYYATAVAAMRAGNTYDAYFNLGKAIHMVQDCTVPHHSTDHYGVLDLHQAYEDGSTNYMHNASCLATTAYPHDPSLTFYLPELPLSTYADSAARISSEWLDTITSWWGRAHTIDAYAPVYQALMPLAQQMTAGILYKFHQNWSSEPYSAIKLTVNRAKALDGPDSWAADLFTSLNVLEPGESPASYSYDFSTDDFVSGYFGDEDEVRPGSYLGYDVWTFPYTSDNVRSSGEVEMVLALWDDDDIDGWTHSVSGWPESWYSPDWLDINPDNSYRLHLKANMATGQVSRWTGRDWVVIGRIGEPISSTGNQSGKDMAHGGRGEIEFTIEAVYSPAQVSMPPNTPRNIFPGTIGHMVTGVTLTPILYASNYSDPDMNPQQNSEWQILDTSDAVVFHTLGGVRSLLEITSPLAPATMYKWQVRYQDNRSLWSDWSRATLFITTHPPYMPANISPVVGATSQPTRPTLTASEYSDSDGNAHTATEWQIDIVQMVMGTPTYLNIYHQITGGITSHRITSDLAANTTYLWRVRYQDALGAWSTWSERTTFSTGPAISVPPTSAILMPTIQLSSPNGGEDLAAGSSYAIRWLATGSSIVSVNIDYSTDAGRTWTAVARGAPNSGSYNWTVPNTPSVQCYVMVTALDSSSRPLSVDQSDKAFNIRAAITTATPAPAVKVATPKQGEMWRVGTQQNIAWSASGAAIAYVNIYFSTDGGKSFRTVAEKETNDGSYTWTVPSFPSTSAMVRVIALSAKGENLAIGDSGIFILQEATTTTIAKASVNVTAPKQGETWFFNTTKNIAWVTTGGGIAYVNISYSTDGGKTFKTVADQQANNGQYAWKVPNVQSQMSIIRITAIGSKGETLAAGDSAVFTIRIQ